MTDSWSEFLKGETLFSNSIRLKNLIWTIQHYSPPGSRILELGFGSGTTAVLMADMNYRVTAVEINEILIEKMKTHYADWIRSGSLEVQQANMLDLPWKEKIFDLAYHQGVLEHFSDEQIIQALTEQARVSKWIIFDVPNHMYKAHPFGDERLLSPRYWQGLIKKAGLLSVNHTGRDFSKWFYLLPYGFFTKQCLERWPWFSRRFGVSSIFVCKSV